MQLIFCTFGMIRIDFLNDCCLFLLLKPSVSVWFLDEHVASELENQWMFDMNFWQVWLLFIPRKKKWWKEFIKMSKRESFLIFICIRHVIRLGAIFVDRSLALHLWSIRLIRCKLTSKSQYETHWSFKQSRVKVGFQEQGTPLPW